MARRKAIPKDARESAGESQGESERPTVDAMEPGVPGTSRPPAQDGGCPAKASTTPTPAPPAAPEPPVISTAPSGEERLRRELEEANRRAEEIRSNLQRVAADFENFKKFAERERGGAVERERASLLRSFLDVYENLERAVEAGSRELSNESALMRGLRLTLESARELLEREGVKRIEAVGTMFNPELHEAVCFVPDPGRPEYTVIEEVRRGYTLNGKLLRPSKVTVATGPAPVGGAGGTGGSGGEGRTEGGASEGSKVQ
ncbi:MAG: nucleotide exchange factor GrpE [Thermoplasmata archaeon]